MQTGIWMCRSSVICVRLRLRALLWRDSDYLFAFHSQQGFEWRNQFQVWRRRHIVMSSQLLQVPGNVDECYCHHSMHRSSSIIIISSYRHHIIITSSSYRHPRHNVWKNVCLLHRLSQGVKCCESFVGVYILNFNVLRKVSAGILSLTFLTAGGHLYGRTGRWEPLGCARYRTSRCPQGIYWPPSQGHLQAKAAWERKSHITFIANIFCCLCSGTDTMTMTKVYLATYFDCVHYLDSK